MPHTGDTSRPANHPGGERDPSGCSTSVATTRLRMSAASARAPGSSTRWAHTRSARPKADSGSRSGPAGSTWHESVTSTTATVTFRGQLGSWNASSTNTTPARDATARTVAARGPTHTSATPPSERTSALASSP